MKAQAYKSDVKCGLAPKLQPSSKRRMPPYTAYCSAMYRCRQRASKDELIGDITGKYSASSAVNPRKIAIQAAIESRRFGGADGSWRKPRVTPWAKYRPPRA